MEQTPDIKNSNVVENDIGAKCCLCRVKWTVYRGQFKCNRSLCRVPVIVCESCTTAATDKPETLVCELCREGYRAPSKLPDLVALKRKADEIVNENSDSQFTSEKGLHSKKPKTFYKDRLFLRRVPLTASFSKIKEAVGFYRIESLEWLTDYEHGGFYGSCIALMTCADDQKHVLERSSRGGIKVDKKKIKVAQVFMKPDDDLFQDDFIQKEYPPVGK